MTSLAFNRDCMEAMREFPDKFFDLAVVDPQYGINITGRSQVVQVERERERERGGQASEEVTLSAVKRTQIGGSHLSRPKSTTRSTTKRHQMPSISRS